MLSVLRRGVVYMKTNIFFDFINIINNIFPKFAYLIEPDECIKSQGDILKEVEKYFKDSNKDILVIKEEPMLIVSIDEKIYIARIDRFVGLFGGNRKIDEPYPINYYGGPLGNVGGFKFIYLYPYNGYKMM